MRARGAPRARPPATVSFRADHPPSPPASVMLVGWGGNNGTTVTGGVLANKLCVGGVGGGAPRIFAGAALRRVRAGGRAAAAGA